MCWTSIDLLLVRNGHEYLATAAGFTVVWALALLLELVGSAVLELTLALFVIVPVLCGRTVIVAVAVAALASVPMLHVTVPDAWVQLP